MNSPFRRRRTMYIDVTGNIDDARETVTRLKKAYLMSKLFNIGEGDVPRYHCYLGFDSNYGRVMRIYSTSAASLIDVEHNIGRWHIRILIDNDGTVYGEVERPSGIVYEVEVVDADMLKFLADVLTYITLKNEKGLADLLGIGMVVLSIYENET